MAGNASKYAVIACSSSSSGTPNVDGSSAGGLVSARDLSLCGVLRAGPWLMTL